MPYAAATPFRHLADIAAIISLRQVFAIVI
jgi:hypothetical protein